MAEYLGGNNENLRRVIKEFVMNSREYVTYPDSLAFHIDSTEQSRCLF